MPIMGGGGRGLLERGCNKFSLFKIAGHPAGGGVVKEMVSS